MSDLTPERLAELRVLAEEATLRPGAMTWRVYRLLGGSTSGRQVVIATDDETEEATARYVAAVNPDVVTALVDDIERLRAVLKYLRAAAHVFPHVNTDRATTSQLGLPDAQDVWCLGCTVGLTADVAIEGIDAELLAGDDQDEWNARARRWMDEYEGRFT